MYWLGNNHSRTTQRQREEICSRYLRGDLLKLIAFDFNLTITSLFRVLNNEGIPRLRKPTSGQPRNAHPSPRTTPPQGHPQPLGEGY